MLVKCRKLYAHIHIHTQAYLLAVACPFTGKNSLMSRYMSMTNVPAYTHTLLHTHT